MSPGIGPQRRRGHLIRVLGVAVTALAATGSLADEAMVTDRPDFTESSSAVPKGTLQIEAGGTYVDIDEAEEGSLGEVLVRWGVVSLSLIHI